MLDPCRRAAGGDRLLLLTDGLPEARETDGDPMGYQALESMVGVAPAAGGPSSWLDALFEGVQQRTGRTPEDDWTAALLAPLATGETS